MRPRPGPELYQKSLKERHASEWFSDRLLRPLAHRLVVWLLPTRVRPEELVLLQGAIGVLAGALILGGWPAFAAPLLLIKALLDNADGQLARAKELASQLGRYLDTEVDFVVNLWLFLALGLRYGEPLLALLAFVALTLLLSADYVLNSPKELPPARGAEPWASWLEAFYQRVFAPQDRFFSACFAQRPPPPGLARWLANLGLSTQHALLAFFLLLDRGDLYLWVVLLAFLGLWIRYLLGVWRTPSPPSPPSSAGPRDGF